MLSGRPHSHTLAKTAFTAACFVLAVFASLGLAHAALAQGVTSNEVLPTELGNVIGTPSGDIRITIARLVRVALGLLGTVALVLIVYAGFIWMTAGGDVEKVDRAKKILTQAVIGLVIILSAFAITSFIIARLLGEEGGGGSGTVTGPDDHACIGLSATCAAGALGNGIIESHYPNRNATEIPRNTRIAITFKSKIDPASMIIGGASPTIAILKSSQVTGTSSQFPQRYVQSLGADDIEIAATPDGKTFVFMQKKCPTDCFGSPSENVFYTVALRGGADGIKKDGGAPAFSGVFNAGYIWEFQVSTVLDLTPPKVSTVVPDDGETGVPRNSMVQVNFNEAVDPVSVAAGMAVTRTGGNVIQGTQAIGNAYRTVEFRTNDACATNSCGETVFCLPGNQDISVRVKTDKLTATPPTGIFPPTGVTDMCGNSLDGNGNGVSDDTPADEYAFAFHTSNEIDLAPPIVVTQDPAAAEGSIQRDRHTTATFSKVMSSTSFNTDSAKLNPLHGGAPTNYSVTTEAVSSVAGGKSDQTKGKIDHDLFSVNQPYSVDLSSALRDLHQNCFYPGAGQSACPGNPLAFCCDGRPSSTACVFP